ncbi:MAG: sugar transferase [Planctomycetes bacterium]|nr:sugar transferase [Planctomycetota bacterium]MBU2597307.1 sugar transferase [Planctomycetota bacterium]
MKVGGLVIIMAVQIILFIINAVLVNIGFLISFLIRYGLSVPESSFLPYKNSFMFLTLIYMWVLAVFGVYKSRFKSSWDLFKRVFSGLFLGTLLSVAFVYVFRIKWGAFPTSVFIISFFINLALISKLNQFILKSGRRIKKKIVVIGQGNIDDVIIGKAGVEKIEINKIGELTDYTDIDEIIICDQIPNEKDMSFIIYFAQKVKAEIVFDPVCYAKLLPERINGNNLPHSLATFAGRNRDMEEFLMRSLDIIGSIAILLVSLPVTILAVILIKLTSEGPVLYKQERVGKDGKVFTLYKFRTMVKDAEKLSGFLPAVENDPRITKLGWWLRKTRLDELPQLINILRSQMSLVGPRPENLYRVGKHKALQELRLAVKPGLTGLAQIRSFYDLNPNHKIKYDYLYIQQRSLLLNLYILARTIPVVLLKKGQ